MNHNIKILAIFLLAGILSACGSNAANQATSADAVISGVYTAVAGTSAAQATAATLTATPLPAATATSTSQPASTQSLPTPTLQTWAVFLQPTATVYWTCANSSLVKDVTIPDGTTLAPGESFVKTWKFNNTGSCAWTSDYSLVFVKGDDMLGSDVTIGETVALTKKLDVSVEMTAPEDAGTYIGYWQLADESGNTFGELVYVNIVVSEDAATVTPTPTITATFTSTPTDAPAPSLTIVPSSTATSGPTTIPATIMSSPATITPTATPTVTSVFLHTGTSTGTPTSTPSPTASLTSPTFTPTPTETRS